MIDLRITALAMMASLAMLPNCGVSAGADASAADAIETSLNDSVAAPDLAPNDSRPDVSIGVDVPIATDVPIGADVPIDAASATTQCMQLISRNVPAFASTGPNDFTGPQEANAGMPTVGWVPPQLPAWIAYDLSGVPAAQRQASLVVWNAIHGGGYVNTPPAPATAQMPVDYTIEMNTAAGGGMPPSTGWTQLAAVTNNLWGTVQQLVDLGGANWIRFSVSQSSDPMGGLDIDLDVYSAPCGASDSWLFMGDSITYEATTYAFSDLPALVQATVPTRWPAVIDAAIGGTNAGTAVSIIDATMSNFPGRYVVLAYGTNDNSTEFPGNMATLVQHVIAAGKIPVIPTVPWPNTTAAGQMNTMMENLQIATLYTQYPVILHGPDLWTFFLNRTDLIASGDVHPNATGQEDLRQQWADIMGMIP